MSDEYDIEVLKFANPTTVTLGSKESADTPGETNPLTLSCGRSVKHKSNFTLLDLDEYDLVLGRPFQKFADVRIMSKMDALQVPTPHGMQELPRWVSTPKGKPQLQFLSRLDMLREMRGSKETYFLQHEGSTDQPPPSPETAEQVIQQNLEMMIGAKHAIKKIVTEQKAKDRARPRKLSKEDLEKPPGQRRKEKPEDQHKDPELDQKLKAAKGCSKDPELVAKVGGSQTLNIPRAKEVPQLEKLLHEYQDVFPEDLPAEPPPEREFNMKIPVKEGTQPPHQAPYRAPADAQEAITQTLEYLYTHGFARDSTSEYAAPVCLAKKSDGTWRFCTDYRRLNDITKESKYPLPRIEDCLDKLGKAKIFSKIDLRSGYWQVRIHPDDIEKTAFRTQYGHHEWLVMPFGLQGAPSCFQRMMNHYLRHFLGKFVLVYLDDVLIYSDSEEEHAEHIRQVLEVLRKHQLYAKGSKCDFWRTAVSFLGYIVRQGKIDRDPSKVQAVQDWPVPATVRELRSFLGLCNFYRKFVKDYA